MGAWTEDADTPVLHGQRVVGRRRRQRRHGRGPHGAAPGRRRRPRSSTAAAGRAAGAARGGPSRRSRRASGSRCSTAPVEVLGDENGWVTGLRCHAHGARRARRIRPAPARSPVPGSEFEIAVRHGRRRHRHAQQPPAHRHRAGLQVNKWGYIEVDERGHDQPCPASSPAATSCAAPPRSSSPWATASARPAAIDAICGPAALPSRPRPRARGRCCRRRRSRRRPAASTLLRRRGGVPSRVRRQQSCPVVRRSRQTEWMWSAPFWVVSYSMRVRGPRTA